MKKYDAKCAIGLRKLETERKQKTEKKNGKKDVKVRNKNQYARYSFLFIRIYFIRISRTKFAKN